jgi:AcrR family transcriptional regulator
VVAAARTSKSAFYQFFESKEDCFRQLLAEEGGALMHAVVGAASAGGDHRERVRRGIEAFVTTCAGRRKVARLLLAESVGLSPGIEAVRRQLQDRFAAMVEAEVRRAQAEDPHYSDVDAAVYGRAVVGAVSEAVGRFLLEPVSDGRRLVAGLCRIFAP